MHNLLALGAGILSSNSIPGVHLLFREGRRTACIGLKSISTIVMSSNTSATPGEVIIPKDEVLISRLLTSNFGDYILWLCCRCVSEAHLALPGNGPQSSRASLGPGQHAAGSRGANCARRCERLLPSVCHWLLRGHEVQSAPKIVLLTLGCNGRHNEWTLQRFRSLWTLPLSRCHPKGTVSADYLLQLLAWKRRFLCHPPLHSVAFSPPAPFVLGSTWKI